MTSHVMHELRVTDMLVDFHGLRPGADADSSARERDHLQVVLIQKVAQRFRTIAIVLQDVAAQLYAAKSELGDFLDGVCVLSVPGDRGIAKTDVRGSRRNGAIKRGEINGRI